jgi:hypothetical protein
MHILLSHASKEATPQGETTTARRINSSPAAEKLEKQVPHPGKNRRDSQ